MHNEGQLQEYIILFNFVHFLLQSTKFYFYLDLFFCVEVKKVELRPF
jgi:hypothetical protein